MKKVSVFLLLVVCVASLSSCDIAFPDREFSKLFSTPKPETTKVFKNLDDEFAPLEEFVVDEIEDEIGTDYETMTIKAETVLYRNKKSSISVSFDYSTAYITIDGHTIETYGEAPLALVVVDLDLRDDFRELALCIEGASADPDIAFIRYDGKNIVPIDYYNEEYSFSAPEMYGYLDADKDDILPTYGAIWANGKGRIITSFDNMGFTEDRVAFSCYDIVDNHWVKSDTGGKKDASGEYIIAEDFSAFYTPAEVPPSNLSDMKYMCNYDFEKMKDFKEGETIEIIACERNERYYAFYVEYNGEKGVITFWTGD
ncbi:MAG: hypothetical protein IJ285_05780 [Clostridia bacterium]|nr:hypothetical protein [Clostridia bacterium]